MSHTCSTCRTNATNDSISKSLKRLPHPQRHGAGPWCRHGLDAEGEPSHQQFLYKTSARNNPYAGWDTADWDSSGELKRSANTANQDGCWRGPQLSSSRHAICRIPREALTAKTSVDAEHCHSSWYDGGAYRCGPRQAEAKVHSCLQQVHGGVDLSECKIYHVSAERPSKRYWKKIFFNLLDMALLNSFELYHTNPDVTQCLNRHDFMCSVLES